MTKDEALDLALEALEGYCEHGVILRPLEVRDALKQARSAPVQEPICIYPRCSCNSKDFCDPKRQQALDKKAENARELKLDYEPVAPVREDWGPGPHECHSLTAAPMQDIGVEQDERVFARIEARKNRDAAAVKEHSLNDVRCQCCGYMTYHREHMGCIRAAAAAPVQEPEEWDERCVLGHCGSPTGCELSNRCRADNTPAAQRQWVGLTDDEISALDYSGTRIEFVRAIEAKLKEKNNGQR